MTTAAQQTLTNGYISLNVRSSDISLSYVCCACLSIFRISASPLFRFAAKVIEGGESILQEPIPKTLSDNEVDPSKIKRKGIHPQGSSGESVVENETKLRTRKSILVWSTIVCVFVLVEVVVIAVVLLKPARK